MDFASENVVPVVHSCSCSYSWSPCHFFPLLVLPAVTRLRLTQIKLLPLYSNLHSVWVWNCPCPDRLLGSYSERLRSLRKGRRYEDDSALAWNEFPGSLRFTLCSSTLKFWGLANNLYALKGCRLLLENVKASSEKSLCEFPYLPLLYRNCFSKIPLGRKNLHISFHVLRVRSPKISLVLYFLL